jgi:hypothetical protein
MMKLTHIRTSIGVCFAALILSTSPVKAADLTGFYMVTDPGTVWYLNIEDNGGSLSGFLQMVQADSTAPDGVKRTRQGFNGSRTGSHFVLTINQSILSSGARITGEVGWNTITLEIPQASGQIAEEAMRKTSVAEINSDIANLSKHAGQAKAQGDYLAAKARTRADATATLADSQQRLAQNATLRPRVLAKIAQDQVALDAANGVEAAAEADMSRLQRIAKQRHADAEAAEAAATSNDETIAANQMQIAANQADVAVNQGQVRINQAQIQVGSANRTFDADADLLRRLDARQVQLRSIISQAQKTLSQP